MKCLLPYRAPLGAQKVAQGQRSAALGEHHKKSVPAPRARGEG